ncbi:MAG: prepilin-type N-terminal cleavage/methylation domain-containing protein [Candidatus Berkelbacteria bacterium]|nr:prepilin-type N-terminal cleavage/methylation domain-containing protein [Candidatus Berkelbacteria bacterium]MCR4308028.1 prepilin-type N-terminal cleavage/methylation domain-containing protein [Candidatus Berkelbacteria bacterium]
MQRKAFTLIELLIVILIIGILVSIGVVGWVSVSQRGRDTTRKSDLVRIKQALQQMYSDKRTYPRFDSGKSIIFGASWQLSPNGVGACEHTPNVSNLGLPSQYLSEIPKDPKDTFDYSGVAADCNALLVSQADRYIYLTPSVDNNAPSENPTAFVLMGTLERAGNEAVLDENNPLKTSLNNMRWYYRPGNYDTCPIGCTGVNANYLVDSKNQ